jgi:NADPH2:quinone reductase
MKAVVVHGHGGPEVLSYEDWPEPVAQPGDLLVEVAAAGVNYIDTYHREGIYEMTLPFVLGLEGSGTVIGLGDGVTDFAVGDTVAWTSALGSYAGQIALPASKAVRVPSGVDVKTAAQTLLQGITAHYLVTSVFEIRPGHTALVHAAAGGVGLLLCQMISSRGGTVIGTVSTDEKAQAATAAGAAHIIRYDKEDFLPRVREITEGVGVDVVYDGVGQATYEGSLRSLKPRGLMALFGQSSGVVKSLDPFLLQQLGSLVFTRPTLANFIATPEEFQWRAGELFTDMASGKLTFTLGGEYALSDAPIAHEDLEARRTSGKLILIP